MHGLILEQLTRGELHVIIDLFIDYQPENGDAFETKFCNSLLKQLKTRKLSPKQLALMQEILSRNPKITNRISVEIMDPMISKETTVKSSSTRKKKVPDEVIKRDQVWGLYTDLYGAVETLSDRDALEEICLDFDLDVIEKAFIDAEQTNKGFRWIVNRLYLSQNKKEEYGKRTKDYRTTQRKSGKKSTYYGQFFTRL